MSNEIRNDIICNSNIDIMEYLILKLESRQRNLSKYANIFNSIDSYESYYQKRKDIFLLFKYLEEELHQAALAIKALVIQNKSLSKESIDTKSFQRNYNKLLQENNYLLIENNNYAQKLKEINNNNNYNRNKSPKRVKSPSFSSVSNKKISYDNKSIKNQKHSKPMKSVSSSKSTISNSKTNHINKNKNNKNNIKVKLNKDEDDIYNCDLDLNDVRQLRNVKNIMRDMKNNKNKLREVIDEHFGRNQTTGNRRNNNFKNN